MAETDDMAIFVRIVQLGSLSAAGRDLRLSPAVVSNRIARLENRMGIRLLNRTTRRVNPTREGRIFFEHCERILNEFEEAESLIAAQTAEPRGAIKISAPVVFGRMHIAPHVPRFMERFPDLQLRLHLTDSLVDLIDEQIDLAIRISALQDSSFLVRTLAPNKRVICAAPSYLEKHGVPKTPDDLLNHNCLLLRFPGSQQYRWTLETAEGQRTLPVSGSMDANNGEVLRQWCLEGHGLALKSLWEIKEDLDAARLVPVLEDTPPLSHAIYAIYPHGAHLPSRVRVLIDYLAEIYAARSYWQTHASAAFK